MWLLCVCIYPAQPSSMRWGYQREVKVHFIDDFILAGKYMVCTKKIWQYTTQGQSMINIHSIKRICSLISNSSINTTPKSCETVLQVIHLSNNSPSHGPTEMSYGHKFLCCPSSFYKICLQKNKISGIIGLYMAQYLDRFNPS